MCGVAGFLLSAEQAKPETEMSNIISEMTGTLANRGPDNSGQWLNSPQGVALGHRRLSILDLTASGHQPMVSPSRRYVISYNGEIYNHTDLRKELQKKGRSFRGHSDTETLLAGFEEWGLHCTLERAAGMFAFALWDEEEKLLHLARDRLGEKPLYYGRVGRSLIFGSQLRLFKKFPGWTGTINRNAIELLLRFSYIPAPFSIYENVYKLLPATVLTLRRTQIADLASVKPESYWSEKDRMQAGDFQRFSGDASEATAEVEAVLRRSVSEKMISDVPLGAFLSGGIDSSLVVALMREFSAKRVKTFTIGFHESEFNEAHFAAQVARHLDTDHTELYLTQKDTLAIVPRMPEFYDEPFADSSQIPTYLVAKLARQSVTVSLSGDGGDELFGGYQRYFAFKSILSKLRLLPQSLNKGIKSAIYSFRQETLDRLFSATLGNVLPASTKQRRVGYKLHRLASILDAASPLDAYLLLVSHEAKGDSSVLNGSGVLAPADQLISGKLGMPDPTTQAMWLDLLTYLPDDILTKVDRATMAVGLESRAPFLDHRLVELAFRLPLAFKIRGSSGKRPLSAILGKHLPQPLIDRPKMGFGIPLAQWLRNDLRDWGEALLNEDRLKQQGYLDPQRIRHRWQEHLSGTRNWEYHLWDVLMFQAWLEGEG